MPTTKARLDALCARLDAERTIDLARYHEDECLSRSEYLSDLALNLDLCLWDIEPHIDALGPDEDFDGLVIFLEDHGDTLREIAA